MAFQRLCAIVAGGRGRRALTWAWLIAALLWLGSAAADLQAHLEPAQVHEGDEVRLVIEAEGPAPSGEPVLAPLREDFEVVGTRRSSETSIVNGRRSERTRWDLRLRPSRLGTIEIPPIAVGDQRTDALTLEVAPLPEGGLGGPGDPLWVELELGADPDALVVQQQVPLVLRAYSARPMVGYEFEIPPIDGAVLTRLGRDQGSIREREGVEYRVLERRLTLNPERSGTLRLPPIRVEVEMEPERSGARRRPGAPGRLLDDPVIERMLGGMAFGGDPFVRGEILRARSEARVLEVAPRPAAFSGEHWLPAEDLRIADSWAGADGGDPPTLAVGEPATRTLTVTARGLSASQIPQIEVPVPDGVRVYPGPSENQTRTDGATLIGVSRQRVTLIPTRGGALELPALELPWWDTAANRQREAVVPALRLQVAGPIADAPAAQAGPAASQASEAPAGPAPSDAAAAQPSAGGGEAGGGWPLWPAAAALVLAGALAAAQFRRLRRRRPPGRVPAPVPAAAGVGGSERQALREACTRGDARRAAQALLAWAALHWPEDPPRNLSVLAGRAGPAGEPIRALERHLYAPGAGGEWDGAALWQALSGGLGPAASHAGEEPGLAPLYPRRT